MWHVGADSDPDGFYIDDGSTQDLFFINPNRNIGISTAAPQYRLQVSSGAGEAGTILAVSTGTSTMIELQGDGDVIAKRFVGDGSQLTNLTGAADDLGDHVATTTLNMANFGMVNVASITVTNFIRTSTLTVIAPTSLPSSLWVSTSATAPHLYVSTTGSVGIGTASPSAGLQVQAYKAGSYSMYVSTTGTAGQYTIAVSSTGVANINNLVIENRTSTPPNPVTGQIWLRVD